MSEIRGVAKSQAPPPVQLPGRTRPDHLWKPSCNALGTIDRGGFLKRCVCSFIVLLKDVFKCEMGIFFAESIYREEGVLGVVGSPVGPPQRGCVVAGPFDGI